MYFYQNVFYVGCVLFMTFAKRISLTQKIRQ